MSKCASFNHKEVSEFVFPPLYEFPPFFTRQPNVETWKSQLFHWVSLILAYCRHKRCVKMDMLKEILNFMENKHNGEWVDNTKKDIFLVYWRTLDEWANMMIQWIEKTGQRNSILTYYELTEGRTLANTEFYKIDPIVFKKVIQVLVKKDMAQVLRGTNEDEFGVKFFGRI
ncbi:hypothetical protein PMAC_001963 [Pneumocystis sp. 'macacae']|nr:hypothetical protein PMAC_001963 [Pneumocystis sp. 'macacae']